MTTSENLNFRTGITDPTGTRKLRNPKYGFRTRTRNPRNGSENTITKGLIARTHLNYTPCVDYIYHEHTFPPGVLQCPHKLLQHLRVHTLRTNFPPAGTYTASPPTLGTEIPEPEGRATPEIPLRKHKPRGLNIRHTYMSPFLHIHTKTPDKLRTDILPCLGTRQMYTTFGKEGYTHSFFL